MASAKYLSITAKITAPEKHLYKHSEEQVVFPGWKAVAGFEETNNVYHTLLKIKKNKIVEYEEIISKVNIKRFEEKLYRSAVSSNVRKEGNRSSINIFKFNI